MSYVCPVCPVCLACGADVSGLARFCQPCIENGDADLYDDRELVRPRAGDIGPLHREVEFEPMPEHAPVQEPAAPQPTEQPDREPVPA